MNSVSAKRSIFDWNIGMLKTVHGVVLNFKNNYTFYFVFCKNETRLHHETVVVAEYNIKKKKNSTQFQCLVIGFWDSYRDFCWQCRFRTLLLSRFENRVKITVRKLLTESLSARSVLIGFFMERFDFGLDVFRFWYRLAIGSEIRRLRRWHNSRAKTLVAHLYSSTFPRSFKSDFVHVHALTVFQSATRRQNFPRQTGTKRTGTQVTFSTKSHWKYLFFFFYEISTS